jgi:hypothetical protein
MIRLADRSPSALVEEFLTKTTASRKLLVPGMVRFGMALLGPGRLGPAGMARRGSISFRDSRQRRQRYAIQDQV